MSDKQWLQAAAKAAWQLAVLFMVIAIVSIGIGIIRAMHGPATVWTLTGIVVALYYWHLVVTEARREASRG